MLVVTYMNSRAVGNVLRHDGRDGGLLLVGDACRIGIVGIHAAIGVGIVCLLWRVGHDAEDVTAVVGDSRLWSSKMLSRRQEPISTPQTERDLDGWDSVVIYIIYAPEMREVIVVEAGEVRDS